MAGRKGWRLRRRDRILRERIRSVDDRGRDRGRTSTTDLLIEDSPKGIHGWKKKEV